MKEVSSIEILILGDTKSPRETAFGYFSSIKRLDQKCKLKFKEHNTDSKEPIPLSGIVGVIGVFGFHDVNSFKSISTILSTLQQTVQHNTTLRERGILEKYPMLLIGMCEDGQRREVDEKIVSEFVRESAIYYCEPTSSSKLTEVAPLLQKLVDECIANATIKAHFSKKEKKRRNSVVGFSVKKRNDQENVNPNVVMSPSTTLPKPNPSQRTPVPSRHKTTPARSMKPLLLDEPPSSKILDEDDDEVSPLACETTYYASNSDLIRKLFTTEAEPEYWKIFLFTWPTFVSKQQILDEITALWDASTYQSNSETTRKLIVKFIRKLLKKLDSEELEQDTVFCSTLLNFANEKVSTFDFRSASDIEKKVRRRDARRKTLSGTTPRLDTRRRSLSDPGLTPLPLNLPSEKLFSQKKVLDWDPLAVAEQLTLIDHKLFAGVKVTRELFNMTWMKDGGKRAPNVMAMTNRTNHIARWVTTEVVKHTSDVKKRAATIKWFIKLAAALRELNNFAGAMYVLAGLNNAAVNRLKNSWQDVGKKTFKTFVALESLLSSNKNYHEYRAALSANLAANIPSVPMLTVTLTALSGVQENSDGEKEKVNFTKRVILYKILHNEVIAFQKLPFAIREDGELLEKLNNLPTPFDDDTAYQMSIHAEPSERTISNASSRECIEVMQQVSTTINSIEEEAKQCLEMDDVAQKQAYWKKWLQKCQETKASLIQDSHKVTFKHAFIESNAIRYIIEDIVKNLLPKERNDDLLCLLDEVIIGPKAFHLSLVAFIDHLVELEVSCDDIVSKMVDCLKCNNQEQQFMESLLELEKRVSAVSCAAQPAVDNTNLEAEVQKRLEGYAKFFHDILVHKTAAKKLEVTQVANQHKLLEQRQAFEQQTKIVEAAASAAACQERKQQIVQQTQQWKNLLSREEELDALQNEVESEEADTQKKLEEMEAQMAALRLKLASAQKKKQDIIAEKRKVAEDLSQKTELDDAVRKLNADIDASRRTAKLLREMNKFLDATEDYVYQTHEETIREEKRLDDIDNRLRSVVIDTVNSYVGLQASSFEKIKKQLEYCEAKKLEMVELDLTISKMEETQNFVFGKLAVLKMNLNKIETKVSELFSQFGLDDSVQAEIVKLKKRIHKLEKSRQTEQPEDE